MIYRVSISDKKRAVAKNRRRLTLTYVLGLLLLGKAIYQNGWEFFQEFWYPQVAFILLLHFAWWYFDQKFRTKLSTTYEVTSYEFIVRTQKQ